MIFKPELVKLILQGKKTQTRRIAHPAEKTFNSCRYRVNHVYKIQPGRGKTGVAAITITAVRREPLGEIDLRDAKREGFRTRQEFIDYWIQLHGSFDAEQPVWVISFQLGDARDEPLLLAARPGAPHGDYVSKSFLALSNEAEALTPTQLAPYVAEARSNDRKRGVESLKERRDRIALELQGMRADLVEHPSRDLAKTVTALEHHLSSLDRKLRSAA